MSDIDYSIKAEDIIRDALYLIEALEEGEPITGEHTDSGLRALNLMVKAWHTKMLRWARSEAILFLEAGKRQYSLQGDNCAADEFFSTRIDGALVTNDTVWTVESTANMTANDQIGVDLGGTRHWTTISTVDSGVQVTVATGIPSAVADGATVFNYTNEAERPVRVFNGRRGRFDGHEVPLDFVARDIYMDQPNKDASGFPTLAYYSPQVGTGLMYIWPTSSSAENVLRFTYQRTIKDFDSAEGAPDFPIEWGEALVYNLAERLAPQYRVPMERRMLLKQEAAEKLEDILEFDADDTSLQFVPDRRWG